MPDLPESERPANTSTGAGTVVAQVAPDADAGPSHPFARRVSILELVGNFLQTLGVWLGQDAMPRMAAALAYRTVFSLIPFLVLSFLVFRLFPNSEKLIADFLEQVIAKSGLDKIATDKQSVGEWLKGTVGSFKGINFGAIGAVSGAVFIYGALALLVDIESSFNAIYGVSRARSWARRIAQYWLIVSLGPLVLYTGFAVGEKFNTWAQESVRQVSSIVENNTGLGTPSPQSPTPPTTDTPDPDAAPAPTPTPTPTESTPDPGQAAPATPAVTGSPAASATPTPTPPRDGSVTAFLIRVTGFLVTVCLSAFLLAVLYLTVPNTSVRLLPAIAGALTGGLLLDLAKSSFRSFFSAESYASVYGSLALLPLFLLWVYITWFIVLLGLRVSFLVQHGRTGVLLQAFSAKNRSSLGGSWMEPARSVAVVVEIADAFAQGRTVAPWKLAEHAGMDEPSLRLLLSNLEAAGVLHRVSSEGREETFALSRPAEAIAVAEIVAIAQSLAGPVSPGATGDLLAKVRSAQLQAVANVNLGSLVSAGKSRRTPRPASPLPAATAAPDAAPAPAAPPSPSTT